MKKVQWRYLMPALLFLVLFGFLLRGLWEDPRFIPSPLIDKPAPAFSLQVLPPAEGTGPAADPVSTGNFAGKPWLLNVWASWCAPCLQEHPLITELAKSGVITVVGMNYKDDPTQARRWLARHGNPFETIVTDPKGSTAIDWGVYGVPETFLVDAQGVIRYKVTGPLTPQSLAELRARIAALKSS